jgi:ubiquinone/menaquinone biosynthesis C-methylase UbiE
LIQRIYSVAARRLYEPVVVKGTFKLFGGDIDRVVREQGRAAAASASGRPLLDIPIGTAYYTDTAARAHGGLLVGADIARGMIGKARHTLDKKGLDNFALVHASIHSLPFRDASFGAVLCTNGLQVIPSLQPALAELARVLQPGAVLYASVLTLPLSGLVSKARLPTMFVSGAHVADAIANAGLAVTSVRQQRLATLIEASKPHAS